MMVSWFLRIEQLLPKVNYIKFSDPEIITLVALNVLMRSTLLAVVFTQLTKLLVMNKPKCALTDLDLIEIKCIQSRVRLSPVY